MFRVGGVVWLQPGIPYLKDYFPFWGSYYPNIQV